MGAAMHMKTSLPPSLSVDIVRCCASKLHYHYHSFAAASLLYDVEPTKMMLGQPAAPSHVAAVHLRCC